MANFVLKRSASAQKKKSATCDKVITPKVNKTSQDVQENLPVVNRDEECFNCGKHVDKYHRFCSDDCIFEFFTPTMLCNLACLMSKDYRTWRDSK